MTSQTTHVTAAQDYLTAQGQCRSLPLPPAGSIGGQMMLI